MPKKTVQVIKVTSKNGWEALPKGNIVIKGELLQIKIL